MNAPLEIRDRLALAFDVPDLDDAVKLADQLSPWFGVAKVGFELYTAAGPDAVRAFIDRGVDVFLDIKLHDIPTTVGRAAAVAGRLGVRYLNAHAAGGEAMLRAGVEGLRDGSNGRAGFLAVTVLTSDPDASTFDERLRVARVAGCDGVVCSAQEIERVHAGAPGFITAVPGTRSGDAPRNDQARVATPAEAVAAGATVLVIGRQVTHANDREAAAAAVHAEIAAAIRV